MCELENRDISSVPMFVNTLENCYKTIQIFGENEEARKIVSYLKDNDNVQIIWQNKGKRCNAEIDAELNLEIGDYNQWAESKALYRINQGKLIYGKFMSPSDDIYENIIPRLTESGIRVIAVRTPNLRRYGNNLRLLLSMGKFRIISKYCKKRDEIILKHFGNKVLLDEFENTKADSSKGYVRVFGNGKYINYDDGFRRIPCENPTKENANSVFLLGFCIAANPMISDDKTIGAHLQKMLGEYYRVYSRSNDNTSINLIMRTICYRAGDIVIFFTSHHDERAIQAGIEVLDLTESYNVVPALWKHIADNSFHCDALITQIIAKAIYNFIQKKSVPCQEYLKGKELYFGTKKRRCPEINMYSNTKLNAYIKELEPFIMGGYCGAIVMNANPFTLGHKYLIERAAEKVEHLYIFVVEEDKSQFKFKDRLQMVKLGVLELKNVSVHPSGRFILSANTLPGYFDKKHLGNIAFSAFEDIELFASIAKKMNISIRFAGTEPKDGYTRNYNKAMCQLLPQYGIEFMEIPRIEVSGGGIISASAVRKLLDEGAFNELKKYVPDSTKDFLRQKKYCKTDN